MNFKAIFYAVVALAIVVSLSACSTHGEHNHKHAADHVHADHSEEDDHVHADEHFPVVAYNADVEFYALVQPFVNGHSSVLTCHLTELKTFKPVADAQLTVSIEVNGKVMATEMARQVSAGEYSLRLTPGTTGIVRLLADVQFSDRKTRLVVDSLEVFASHDEADADLLRREQALKRPNAVPFPKVMSWTVDFATEPVQLMPIGQVIKTVALVQPSVGDEQLVVASVDGVVNFVGNSLVEGKTVKAGQTICHIDASSTINNNLTSQQQMAATELQRAKSEFERLSALSADKLVLESEVLAAKANYENAQQRFNALNKNGNGRQVAVKASRSGFVKQLMVTNGQYVTAGSPVMLVSEARTLSLKANVSPRYYSQLKNISGANIRHIDNGLLGGQTWSLEQLHGRLLSFGRQVDGNAALVPVFFEVDNVADLLPGSYVEMFILTSDKAQTLVVPCAAVQEDMGLYFVYVQVAPEVFEKRQVHLGVSTGQYTEIKEGLKVGERVVAKGAVLVKMQQAAGVVDPHSGHSH